MLFAWTHTKDGLPADDATVRNRLLQRRQVFQGCPYYLESIVKAPSFL